MVSHRPSLLVKRCITFIYAHPGDQSNIALQQFRSSGSADDVTFTVKYFPYQLMPEMNKDGEDKYQW